MALTKHATGCLGPGGCQSEASRGLLGWKIEDYFTYFIYFGAGQLRTILFVCFSADSPLPRVMPASGRRPSEPRAAPRLTCSVPTPHQQSGEGEALPTAVKWGEVILPFFDFFFLFCRSGGSKESGVNSICIFSNTHWSRVRLWQPLVLLARFSIVPVSSICFQ